jgi:hypothetical protein
MALLQVLQKIINQYPLEFDKKGSVDRIDLLDTVKNYSVHYYPKMPNNTLIKITSPLSLSRDDIPDFAIESMRLTFKKNEFISSKNPNPLHTEFILEDQSIIKWSF